MGLLLSPTLLLLAALIGWPGVVQAAELQSDDPGGPARPSLLLEQESRVQDPKKKPPAPESEGAFRMGAEFWLVTLRGDLESSVSGITDTKFSISGDAGMNDGLAWKLFFDLAPGEDMLFRLSLRHLDESGSKTLGQQVVFDGVTFPIGSQVSSDLRIDWYGLEARIPARLNPQDSFQGQLLVAFTALNAEVDLSGPAGTGRQRYALEFLDMGIDFKTLLTEGLFLGANFIASWAIADQFIGGEAALKGGFVSARVAVDFGYRWWSIGGAINDEPDLDLRIKGPYFSALFRF
jgi:hypothetical protein